VRGQSAGGGQDGAVSAQDHSEIRGTRDRVAQARDDAYFAALADVKAQGNLPVPMELRNASSKLMDELGYGKGYEKYSKKDLLPEKLRGKKYFSGGKK